MMDTLILVLFFIASDFNLSHNMESFRVGTLNVNGARVAEKRALVFDTARRKRVEVLFLQETYSDEHNQADWAKEWEGQVVLSHLSTASGGVGLLFLRSFTPTSVEVEHVVKGRCLLVTACFNERTVVFINVYAPTNGTERKSFLEKVSARLNRCGPEDFLIMGGDFNCTECEFVDRNHAEPHPGSQHALKQLVHSHGLVDAWRRMHADCRQYTWSRLGEDRISMARLDRFYVFKHHFNALKSCSITPAGFTDHSLVLCHVFIKNVLPKSAYWHFNSVLTSDKGFREALIYFWTAFRRRKSDFTCLRQWWDHGKTEIRLLCQQYTLNVTRDACRSIRELESEIVDLEILSAFTENRGHIEALKSKKMALKDLLGTKVQGALVRSRVQNIAEMDAPSSFFFGLEKRHGQRKAIHCLLSDTGQELTEPGQLRKRATEFYSALYSSEYREREDLFEEFCGGLPQVSEATNVRLDGPLSVSELHAALQRMQGRRAPGINGLTVEFYKAYWDIVAPDLLEVFNESLSSGSLPVSCRRAVMALLPKKGNLQDIRNWRPVSLLCTDYKILSKVLATRLREAMEEVIHRDQTYCVPGRSIVDNVHLIRDVLKTSSLLGLNTGLISLDQEKAFDRVEHRFLWKTMERFGFRTSFIAKIQALYGGIESVLKLSFNGSLCAPFRACRGVRQGCALSGMLYALSLEPLLCKIRSSIAGFVLPGFNKNIVLSAYADDVVILTQNQSDVDVLSRLTDSFNVLSSARVNWRKSEALAVGEWRDGLPVLPQSLCWKRDGFKYLGVFLGDEDTEKKNWEDIPGKVEGKLNKWRWLKSQMSYRGRVLVVNNLVASMLWHRLACLQPPPGLLDQIQKKIVDFFWDKKHWVPQGVLFLPREEGGQGLIHVASRTATFRLQFVQRFLTGPADLVWRETASCLFRRVSNLGLDAALFLIDSKSLKVNGLPPFYQSVLKSWALFKNTLQKSSNSLFWLLNQPLLYNARMDISREATPGLKAALLRSRTLVFKQVVDAAGPALTDAGALRSRLGVRTTATADRALTLWRKRLTGTEVLLLAMYSGGMEPNPEDPFPDLYLTPRLGDTSGPLLEKARELNLHTGDKKAIYLNCVRATHRARLNHRPPTVWSSRLGGDGGAPCWRVLYKPPIQKRTADLQWRLLHGAIACNAVVSAFSSAVSNTCPFCGHPETLFHFFSECERLTGFFTLLAQVFNLFNVGFCERTFIYGAGYKKTSQKKWQLLNFVCGAAKLAIYVTRRNKVEGRAGQDAASVWRCSVRCRLRLEFGFYKMTDDQQTFIDTWCFGQILCSVDNNILHLSKILNY
uniref:Pol-like protein n=1 Tax=Tetraodon nigroviridis TaxID=99883 RepID=Q76IM5_TETNG|nr:pol-like protein [Tetraodon nigroviridis]